MNRKDNIENTDNINKKIKLFYEEVPLIRTALSFNSFVTLSPFAETTAIQTGDLQYRAFPYLDTGRIGEMYMLNSKSSRYSLKDIFGINLYMSSFAFVCEAKNEERSISMDKKIQLPKHVSLKTALDKAIIHRKSHRHFENISLQFKTISSILYYCNGISGKLQSQIVESEFLQPLEIKTRTVSSAGGLYPLDIYLIALNIENLENGIYLYLPVDNSLVSINNTISKEQIFSSFDSSSEVIQIRNASFIIVITGKIWKLIRKYGNRGLKFMFIEAGEISQNIHLSAQSMGVGTVDTAGYYDNEIEKIVGIDGINEFIMHSIIGGII
jgi:SagB-type dehydrogenase family enzyme